MKIIISFVLLISNAFCMAETYLSAELRDGSNQQLQDDTGTVLLITTDHGTIKAPLIDSEQVGFSQPKISENKQLIGWTVDEKSCCTSYPLPLSLVIYQNGKVIRTISAESTIPAWSFANNDTAVAIRSETAHFVTGISYELYSISSGELLQRFACHVDYSGERHTVSDNVPAWVWPIKGDCPYTSADPD